MLSLTKLEVVRDSDRPSRVGESLSGTVRAELKRGKSLDYVELRFEQERPKKRRSFRPVRVAAGVEGPGTFDIPFSVEVPQGAFSHESKRVPVQLWLVASASNGSGLREGRLELVDGSFACVTDTASEELVFDGDGRASILHAVAIGTAIALLFVFISIRGEFALLGTIATALCGIVAGAFFGHTWWEDENQTAKVSLNLKRATLSVSPGTTPSTMEATLELDAPPAARVTSVRLRWVGADGVLKHHKRSYWKLFPFVEREVVFVENGELEAGRVHRFQDTFPLPEGATPSFKDKSRRVYWFAEVSIDFEDAEAQLLRTDIEVVPVDPTMAAELAESPESPLPPFVARRR